MSAVRTAPVPSPTPAAGPPLRVSGARAPPLSAGVAGAQDWPRIDHPAEGVTLAYDDYEAWGGGSMGTSHQNKADYRVRRHLDLSAVPQEVFERAPQSRLSS